jgi:tRNA pseudouridine38-40 synthase
MPRFALRLDVDGAGFAGTQVQGKGERTVAGVLAIAAAAIPGGATGLRLSSRLDAGVAARGLVLALEAGRTWEPRALVHACNQHLPRDVVATAAAAVPDAFDPIRWAAAKTYRYAIIRRGVRPWLRRLDQPEQLDLAGARFVGTHDLSGFACLRHDGSDNDDPVRTIRSLTWTHHHGRDEDTHDCLVTGTGFLYRQVRGLVGAMVQVARTRATLADIDAAIRAGRAAIRVGDTAPPDGLALVGVDYGPREPAWVPG